MIQRTFHGHMVIRGPSIRHSQALLYHQYWKGYTYVRQLFKSRFLLNDPLLETVVRLNSLYQCQFLLVLTALAIWPVAGASSVCIFLNDWQLVVRLNSSQRYPFVNVRRWWLYPSLRQVRGRVEEVDQPGLQSVSILDVFSKVPWNSFAYPLLVAM